MVDSALIRRVSYEGFEIQAAACLRGKIWYPEYEISQHGEVVFPWRAPDIDGRGDEGAACDWGIALAIEDIDLGLKKIFR